MEDQSADMKEVISEMDEAIGEFEAEAAENRRKREQAMDSRDGEEEEGEETPSGPEVEYEARLFLVVPYSGSSPGRPLARRPQASPPLSSSGLSVQGPTDFTGQRLEVIKGGAGTYDVTCAVDNYGGLGATSATVELFVEHERASATVDTNGGTLLLDPASTTQRVTGHTTLPPESKITTVGFVGNSLSVDSMFHRVVSSEVGAGRTFSVPATEGSAALRDRIGKSGQVSGNAFTFRVYDTTTLSWSFYADPGNDRDRAKQFVDVLKNSADAQKMAEVPGQFQAGTNARSQLDLSSRVANATQVGTKRTLIPSGSRESVTFQYAPPKKRNGRVLTAFYARAYSLSPPDTPQDWGQLDHTRSRFVGREEMGWYRLIPL